MSQTINLNDEKFAGDGSFEAIPAGQYNVSVFSAKVEEFGDPKPGKANNKGKKYLNVQFRISDGEYTNRRLFTIVGLFGNWASKDNPEPNEDGAANFTLANFFKALGFEEIDLSNTEKLIDSILGEELVLTVKRKPGYKDPDVMENEVSGFKAKGSTKTTATVAKPSATMKI